MSISSTRQRQRTALFVTLTATLLHSPLARAQQTLQPSPVPTNVGTVQVKAAADKSRDLTKRTIGRAQLDNPDTPYAIQALRQAPGVIMSSRGISLLGNPESDTRILIDGRPPGMGRNYRSLASADVDRIEYTFGSDAAFAGSGAAGTINFILRKNAAKPSTRVMLGSDVGKLNTNSQNIVIARPIGVYDSHTLNVSRHSSTRPADDSTTSSNWFGLQRPSGYYRTAENRVDRSDTLNLSYSMSHQFADSSRIRGTATYGTDDSEYQRNVTQFESLNYDATVSSGHLKTRRVNRGINSDWSKTFANDSQFRAAFDIKNSTLSSQNRIEYVALSRYQPGRFDSSGHVNGYSVEADYRRGLPASLQWHVGARVEAEDNESSGQRTGGLELPATIEIVRLQHKQSKAVFAKIVKDSFLGMSINAGVRLTQIDLSGSSKELTLRRYDVEETTVEPSISLSKSLGGRKVVVDYSRAFNMPRPDRLMPSELSPLDTLNLPLSPRKVYHPDGAKPQITDSLVLSSELYQRNKSTIFGAFSLKQLHDIPIEAVYTSNGVWYSRSTVLPSAQVHGLSLSAKTEKKTRWPHPGTLELQGSANFNHVNANGIDAADTINWIEKKTFSLDARYRAAPIDASLMLIYRQTGKNFRGPNLYSDSQNTLSSVFAVGTALKHGWSARMSVISFLGPSRFNNSMIYDDGTARMTSTSRSPNNPYVSLTLSYTK